MSLSCCVCDTEVRDPGGDDLRGHLPRGRRARAQNNGRPRDAQGLPLNKGALSGDAEKSWHRRALPKTGRLAVLTGAGPSRRGLSVRTQSRTKRTSSA